MSKNNKQKALQKAQQHISGNKLTKSGVKTLENKGFTSKQIQAVAGSMNVGGKAQDRIDAKHSSAPAAAAATPRPAPRPPATTRPPSWANPTRSASATTGIDTQHPFPWHSLTSSPKATTPLKTPPTPVTSTSGDGSSGGGSSKVSTLGADRRILVDSQGRAVDTTTSKNNKQEALQKAQQHISGNKLTKSEVKTLENKGFTSKQIQAVAGSMNVGGKAQDRIDAKHSSGDGSSGGGSSKVRTLGADRRILVDSQGRAVDTTTRWTVDSPGLMLNQKQADKINKKVDKYGGSLTGGKGMTVAGFVTVTEPGARTEYGTISPSAKHQLAIYSPVRRKKDKGDKGNKGSGEAPSTGGTGSGSGSGSQDRQQQNAYQLAQDRISARTPDSQPPQMFQGSIRPGFAVEDVASYADRLGVYNANYSGWMQDRATADRYESGTMLRQFAGILPKAPDVISAKDMIDMANRMNNKIQVG